MADALAIEAEQMVELANGEHGNMTVETEGGRREVPVYDVKTGVESRVLPYMLPGVLAMKDPKTGQRRFSAVRTVEPEEGTYRCLLNADSKEHSDAVEAGVSHVECTRTNLRSGFDLRNHMQYVHPKEWEAILAYRQERKDEMDREFQRLQMDALRGQTGAKSGTR